MWRKWHRYRLADWMSPPMSTDVTAHVIAVKQQWSVALSSWPSLSMPQLSLSQPPLWQYSSTLVTVRGSRGCTVCPPHPLHLRQVLQQADGVLRVGLVVLAACSSYSERPRGHGLQHCLIQVLGDQRVGQLSQVVLQYSWKVGESERSMRKNCGIKTVSGC